MGLAYLPKAPVEEPLHARGFEDLHIGGDYRPIDEDPRPQHGRIALRPSRKCTVHANVSAQDSGAVGENHLPIAEHTELVELARLLGRDRCRCERNHKPY
ncbi:MAG: hypothetical protein UX74_C0028G0005 [Parcubacteria group bacterium GW2011_GWA2_47_10b]|nr:MAG: hypothetical protein UX74_C0028G0005 [Parcubacteria group bacterium GW2011_GWA2_47_10b]